MSPVVQVPSRAKAKAGRKRKAVGGTCALALQKQIQNRDTFGIEDSNERWFNGTDRKTFDMIPDSFVQAEPRPPPKSPPPRPPPEPDSPSPAGAPREAQAETMQQIRRAGINMYMCVYIYISMVPPHAPTFSCLATRQQCFPSTADYFGEGPAQI